MFENISIESPWLIVILSGCLGLAIGSFLNVVIYRTPITLNRKWNRECLEYLELDNANDCNVTDGSNPAHYSIIHPPSSCPSCKSQINPWQNIPVLSYLFLRGKCSNCNNPIGIRYPLVEILTAVLTILVALKFGLTWTGLGAMVLTWSLIALTGIDFDTQLLPDGICLPLLWLGLIVNSFNTFVSLNDAVWGAIAGYMILWSVFWVFKLLTDKDGMGFGDFKLLAALGAWMGWQTIPMIVLIAAATGLIIAILMVNFMSHDRRTPIAFGPYLAIAGWLSFMYGSQIASATPLFTVF